MCCHINHKGGELYEVLCADDLTLLSKTIEKIGLGNRDSPLKQVVDS